MLQTMALSFICSKCSPRMMSLLPVAVTMMSHSFTASTMRFTSYPSIAACKAQIGSISVTMTRQPALRSESAVPLPTSPYPATTATFPAIMMSVARRIASTADSLHPYLLSNFDFVTESLTLIAGIGNVPAFIRSYRRKTPVVVSSERPLMPAPSSGYSSRTMLVKSPPSSKIIFNCLRSSPKNSV